MHNFLEHNGGTVPNGKVEASTVMDGAEDTFPLKGIVRLLWTRLWVIMAATIVIVGGAVGFGLTQTPTYEASTRVLVSQKQAAGDPFNLAGDVEGLRLLTQTLASAVNSRPLAQAVTQRLNLSISPNELMANMRVEEIPDTQFVQITYKDSSPERAQRVVNTMADVFSARISEISPKASGVTAIVWEPATVPTNPVSPNFMLIIPLALVLGTVLGVMLALLLEYWASGWRSAEEIESAVGRPVIAVIPAFKVSKGKKKVR
jgi:capsular polysaccharide biosynthesis protein